MKGGISSMNLKEKILIFMENSIVFHTVIIDGKKGI